MMSFELNFFIVIDILKELKKVVCSKCSKIENKVLLTIFLKYLELKWSITEKIKQVSFRNFRRLIFDQVSFVREILSNYFSSIFQKYSFKIHKFFNEINKYRSLFFNSEWFSYIRYVTYLKLSNSRFLRGKITPLWLAFRYWHLYHVRKRWRIFCGERRCPLSWL
jgi:hypothetical protein